MLKRKPLTEGLFWEKFTVTASKVIEKVLTFKELKRVQECCELSIWQMTVKLKVIDIRPCLPGVINAIVSEYSSMIFLMYKCTIARLGDHPPSLRGWSTWLSVKRPPFSIAAFRTNLVAKPCKRQKVTLELFTHGTNYTLLDADCLCWLQKLVNPAKWNFNCDLFEWVVPEKIHTPLTDGILEILAGGGVEDSGNPGRRGGWP